MNPPLLPFRQRSAAGPGRRWSQERTTEKRALGGNDPTRRSFRIVQSVFLDARPAPRPR
ncbi:hypothetical protein KPATCC21470_8087 [Kitasatospora purpeofusca]